MSDQKFKKGSKSGHEEIFKAETTWFHIFRAMIVNGDIAKIGAYALTVYIVIKGYTDFNTGQAFPSLEFICKKSGISDKQVRRSLEILEEHGYISKQKIGRNNIYTLREKIEMSDTTGRPVAIATWDYIPNCINAARAELKNFLMTGKSCGQIVHIDTINMNIQINQGGENTQNNIDYHLEKINDPKTREFLRQRMAESSENEPQ
ncbi:MAG: helix-turn-helix domain-containing protein [Desulfocapsaceae bacterium]|nr:helix-turn-helix domain-containing protein [Desulfocapsaceae bacterium]MDD3816380.1 helix-turn-helix domain-containing protein [Desulfocapsaceae bacterium]